VSKLNEILIVLNGVFKNKKLLYKEIIDRYSTIIAVDGGYKFLQNIVDRKPDAIIGDFDSLDRDSKLLKNYNGEILKFPSHKDKTDAELAVDYCLTKGHLQISFIGAYGGRADQQFGNILLLEYAALNSINARIIAPGLEIGLIENKRTFNNKKNFILSIFALTKDVIISSLRGCRYELDDYRLNRASSRGISNVIEKKEAVITIETGKLLYFISKKL